jgi:hypothetical protein
MAIGQEDATVNASTYLAELARALVETRSPLDAAG